MKKGNIFEAHFILGIFLLYNTTLFALDYNKLKELGIKQCKLAQEKMNKLVQQQPELKKYISRPSKRKLIKQTKQIDTIYVLGIRVEFEEDTSSLTTGNGLMDLDGNEYPYDKLGEKNTQIDSIDWPFDSIVNGKPFHNIYYDPPHTKKYFEHLLEALQNYWWSASNHKLWIEFKVMPEGESTSYKLTHNLLYYGDIYNWVRGLLTLIRDAILTCDEQSPEIDFSKYALNNGAVIIFHAGGMWQTDYFGNSPYDIPAVFISGIDEYFGTPIWVDNGTIPINDAILYPQTAFQDGMPVYMQGGLAHEFGHLLGLYDLYDTQYYTTGMIGVGGWDLMGTGNWNLDGLLPPYPCAWNIEKLGFIQPISIDKDSEAIFIARRGDYYNLSNQIYKIPINTNEYFLIENRIAYVSQDTTGKFECYEDINWTIPKDCSQTSIWHLDSTGIRVWKDGVLVRFNDYDWGLPPDSMKGGLAIWHIDKNKIAKDSINNEINAGLPKGVDMEEADGIQDFETPAWQATDIEAFFYGSKYDVFFRPSADKFTPYTLPKTHDNNNLISYIFIDNISESDTIMNFSVRFGAAFANFPVKCGSFFDINSTKVCDASGSPIIFSTVMDTTTIAIGTDTSFVGGIIYAIDRNGNIIWTDTTLAQPGATNPYGTNLYSSCGVGDIDGNNILDVITCPFVVWSYIYGTHKKTFINPRNAINIRQVKNSTKIDTFIKIESFIYIYDIYGNIKLNKKIADGMIVGAPLIVDINKDGKDEIIIGSTDGYLYALNESGNYIWRINLHEWIYSTPVYDSSDNTIYANSFDGQIYAIGGDGKIKWEKLEPSLAITTSSPVVADINSDGKKEIILARGNGKIVCLSIIDKITLWEYTLQNAPFITSPAISDIDGDSLLDVVVAAGDKIYAINSNGANIPGFPIYTRVNKEFQSSPVIADIIGDENLEIIIGASDGKLLVYNNKGKLQEQYLFSVGGEIYSTPSIYDLNLNNKAEIIIGCDDGKLYAWEAEKCYNLLWPMRHKNLSNNGIYELVPKLPIVPENVFMEKEFYIYPNPITSNGWIHCFPGNAEEVNIIIMNIAGDIVKRFNPDLSGKDPNNYQDIEMPNLPPGVYICRVEVKTKNKKYIRNKKFGVAK